jgi:predicted sulfurtransferase
MHREHNTNLSLLFRNSEPHSSNKPDSKKLGRQLSIAVLGVEPPTAQSVSRFTQLVHERPVRQPLNGKVLLFYHYCTIEQPQELLDWQVLLCGLLRLRGRIHVGKEGMNGTVGGSCEAIRLYKESVQTHCRWSVHFGTMPFKESSGGHHCFPNLFVRVCREICQMNLSPELIHWKNGGRHLKAVEFHKLVEEMNTGIRNKPNVPTDTVLLDVRNLYESAVGQFDGAIRIPTRHFIDFPEVADRLIERYDLRKKKKVLMYCTGGIRCERASAYLRSKGVTQCFQLLGGIHNYVEEMGEATFFRGKNFVFDRRLTTKRVGTQLPVSTCIFCDEYHDEYDKHFSCDTCSCLVLVCKSCRTQKMRTAVCSTCFAKEF